MSSFLLAHCHKRTYISVLLNGGEIEIKKVYNYNKKKMKNQSYLVDVHVAVNSFAADTQYIARYKSGFLS